MGQNWTPFEDAENFDGNLAEQTKRAHSISAGIPVPPRATEQAEIKPPEYT